MNTRSRVALALAIAERSLEAVLRARRAVRNASARWTRSRSIVRPTSRVTIVGFIISVLPPVL